MTIKSLSCARTRLVLYGGWKRCFVSSIQRLRSVEEKGGTMAPKDNTPAYRRRLCGRFPKRNQAKERRRRSAKRIREADQVHFRRCTIARPITQSLSLSERKTSCSVK